MPDNTCRFEQRPDRKPPRFHEIKQIHSYSLPITQTMQVAGGIEAGGGPYIRVVTLGPGITDHSGLLAGNRELVGTLNSAYTEPGRALCSWIWWIHHVRASARAFDDRSSVGHRIKLLRAHPTYYGDSALNPLP